MSEDPRVRTRDALAAADVAAVAEGRLLALRIPGYADAEPCRRLAAKILEHPELDAYGYLGSARRLGMVHYEAMAGPAAAAAYFAAALASIRAVRAIFHPALSPIDRLRLELDEIWPGGAMLAAMTGAKMFVGTLRAFDDASAIQPHVDFLPDDVGEEPWTQALTGQMAANVYLKPADRGGELELWDLRPDLAWQDGMEIPGGYGFPRTALPEPAVRLLPEPGELILFDSRNVHSVAALAGARLALSCFVGSAGPDRPLMLWS